MVIEELDAVVATRRFLDLAGRTKLQARPSSPGASAARWEARLRIGRVPRYHRVHERGPPQQVHAGPDIVINSTALIASQVLYSQPKIAS